MAYAHKALIAHERESAKKENRTPRRLDFGYRSGSEHAMKRWRLGVLRAQCARLERDLAAGTVHVTRGGKQLQRNRLHLDEAGLTEETERSPPGNRQAAAANGRPSDPKRQHGTTGS